MKLECKKRAKKDFSQCEICGLYHNFSKINIEEVLLNIKSILKRNNKKIKLYKLDGKNKIYLSKGICKFFDWIFYSWIELSIKDIENITKFLSYLYYGKLLNISECATMYFGYLSIYLNVYEKYYYYWSSKAINCKSYLAIKWAIEDYKSGACKFRKRNLHKAKKLIKISQGLNVNPDYI